MLHFAPWKIIVIVLVCLAGIVTAHPNLYSRDTLASWPDWLPKSQLALGLDLQGGSHLLLDMNTEELVDPWLKAVRDDARGRLREAKIRYRFVPTPGRSRSRSWRRPVATRRSRP